MSKESEITSDEKLQKDIKNAVIQAFQELELEKDQLHGSRGWPKDTIVDAVKSAIKPMYDGVNQVSKNVNNIFEDTKVLTDIFTPKITPILSVPEIKEMMEFSKQYFNPLTIYKTLNSLSNMQSNLKTSQALPLTSLFSELNCLVENIGTVLSEYTPPFLNCSRLLNGANTATENATKIVAELEPYLKYGLKVPDTFDLEPVIMTLKELNKQLTDIDIKALDKNLQKEWKPVKIGLVCVLDIIKDILTLLGQILPLNIALGAGGGVAAGVNAHQ
ncbi:MAG: hypothetical protein PVF29_12440 [Desulfobacterales bacterium]|jgi:hypothetical protein